MRLFLTALLCLCFVPSVFAQQTGATDLAMGGSSAMWIPTPSSLFLNPAELARLRQGDFSFNTGRFTKLSSFSASFYAPDVGTFGAGVGVVDSLSQYTVGYAAPIGRYHGFGVALTTFRRTKESLSVSFGTSLHFPGSIENSGIHAAASIINFSEITSSRFFSINLGAGFWVSDDAIRVQAAFQHTAVKNYALVGFEALPASWMSIQFGTRSFKEMTGGFVIRFAHGSLALGASKIGVVLSVGAVISSLATDERDANFELALDAADEERFAEAVGYYRRAVDFDPFFTPAIVAAGSIERVLEEQSKKALVVAANLMASKDFEEATKAYSRLLKMDPQNDEARKGLNSVQPRMRPYINQLIATGDSLRDRREVERASRSYEQAQELDPENESLSGKIASLRTLARGSVRSLLTRAKSRLDRNQLDEAQKDYERVLATEPRNNQARQGINAIKSKRRDLEVERGKEIFALENYEDALTIFLNVLQQDERHREARAYLDSTRQILLPEVDNYFRSGLQSYTKENYKAAIEEWDKALLIKPDHLGTLEYRKRAEEKLKALERLK